MANNSCILLHLYSLVSPIALIPLQIVEADEAASNEAAAAAQAIKDDRESELAEALPALLCLH